MTEEPSLEEQVAHYRSDLTGYAQLTDRQAELLDGVAMGLLGDERKAQSVNWSDLPSLAKRVKLERDAYFEELRHRDGEARE